MKTLHYFLQPVSDAERKAFLDIVSPYQGHPKQWYAFNEDGMLVECESRVIILPWDKVSDIITMGTLREIKLTDPNIYERIQEYLHA